MIKYIPSMDFLQGEWDVGDQLEYKKFLLVNRLMFFFIKHAF